MTFNFNFWKKGKDYFSLGLEKNKDTSQDFFQPDEGAMVEESNNVVIQTDDSLLRHYVPEPSDPEKAKKYFAVSRWALYVGIFLIPLLFLPWTSNPTEINKQIVLITVAGIGMISWLLGIVSSGYLPWRSTPLDKGVMALLGAFVVGSIFSVARINGLFGHSVSLSNSLASIASLTAFYFLIVNIVEDRGKVLKMILGLSLVLTLLYGVMQLFGVYVFSFSFSKLVAFNSVGSLNALGLVAAASLPFFLRNRLDLWRLKVAYLDKIGVALALVILVVLNWWVLWSVVIVGMIAIVAFENLRGEGLKIKKLVLPMLVVVIGVFLTIVNLNLSFVENNLSVEVSPSFNLSGSMAQSVIKENLLFGYGSENFYLAFDKYGANRLANTTLSSFGFLDAASEILTLTIHGGLLMVIALLFILWCLGAVFWRFNRYALENTDNESIKENVGVLASLAALVFAMFLYPFNSTLFLLLYTFMGLTALLMFNKNLREFNIEEKTSISLLSSLSFIGGLILVLVGVYFVTTMYISDIKYAQALSEDSVENRAALLTEAINWNNKDSRYYRFASQTVLDLLRVELDKPASSDKVAKIQNYVTTSIGLARRATEIVPQESQNWINLGFVYQNLIAFVDGVDKLSEDSYLKAAELRPGDPNVPYQIGVLYLNKFNLLNQLVATGRINASQVNVVSKDALNKAETNFKKAVNLAPNFGLAIYNLGVIYDRQGQITEAIKQLEKIAPANSNQAGLAFELGLLYYRVNRKNDAFNQLERAVVLAPDYANARWYLALIYEERGNLDAAIDQLERILSVEVNKGNSVVLQKLKDLKAGITATPPINILGREPIQ